MIPELSQEQLAVTQQVLSKLEPGKLPLDIFNEVTRLTVTPVIELVPLRREADNIIKVLLAQRGDDDPNWAGMLYVPGTIVLPTDTGGDFEGVLQRLHASKLHSVDMGEPIFVETVLCKVKRGMEVAIVFYAEITEESTFGKFYNVADLPEGIIEGQEGFIHAAVRKYKQNF